MLGTIYFILVLHIIKVLYKNTSSTLFSKNKVKKAAFWSYSKIVSKRLTIVFLELSDFNTLLLIVS